MDRMKLAARLEAWIAQEVEAGRLRWQTTAEGHVALVTGTKLAKLRAEHEDLVEMALDLPDLSTKLRKGDALSFRAWSLVAERLGTDGPLPALADVLATRRAYWAACDAAHERRLAAHKAAAQVAHPKTPETPSSAPAGLYGAQTSQALPENTSASRSAEIEAGSASSVVEPVRPYKPPRYLDGELVEAGDPWPEETYTRQLRWLADRAELDAPRAEVGEPWWVRRLADDVARQDFNPKRYEREMARLTPPAWMDEAPAWGEEVRDDEGDEEDDALVRGADGDRGDGVDAGRGLLGDVDGGRR